MFRENVKHRARIKITYEGLATLLGIDPDCIINVTVEPTAEFIGIVIDDPKYSYALAEGSVMPDVPARFKHIPVAYVEPKK